MKEIAFPNNVNDTSEVIGIINTVTNQMNNILKRLNDKDIEECDKDIKRLWNNIQTSLRLWVGNTYVGEQKEKKLQKAFQSFFIGLNDFLVFCHSDINVAYPHLKQWAHKILYRGTVYRYLGYNAPVEESNRPIEVQYDGIYVSWSKEPENNYLTSKLYGVVTFLKCEISEPYYGIDLEAFGVSRGKEREVVFPTLKDSIVTIEYREPNYEEESEN